MGTQRCNLNIVFHDIQPETLYGSIRHSTMQGTGQVGISAAGVSPDVFQSVARLRYPSYSYEEIGNIHRQMTQNMIMESDMGASVSSVFHLLVRMGQRVLRHAGDGVVCDFSETMAWRSVSLELGQDLFTTAFLAYEDLLRGLPARQELAWDAIIRTNDHRLHAVLHKGLAENHCHLGGTTQAFPLTWAALMNFPAALPPVEKMLERNLHPQISRGYADNVWPWRERILWAQHLRLELFLRLEEGTGRSAELDMEEGFYAVQSMRRRLKAARFCFGARIPQYKAPPVVLDYALRQSDCANGLLKRHTRLLSGERSFLYRCFRACFNGTFQAQEQNWFYLYLLIKENFRSEIVQTNSQAGFYNFMKYQNRKDTAYDKLPGYHAEALRLAVNANRDSQGITSFEARIAPKKTPEALRRQLEENENYIRYAGGLRPGDRHFYVYHFIKRPDSDDDKHFDRPRNFPVRRDCRQQARAIAHELLYSQAFCSCVLGIDAANLEIGCRPETFAVEFRYLRGITPIQDHGAFLDRSTAPHIYATYHAGEDFLDIADGLRAIDEAIRFLNLRRGDRIAHALALGVEPEVHYEFKRRHFILPKQDLLDNVVWLLFRSGELGIDIKPQLRAHLEYLSDKLFFEIYGKRLPTANRYQYYCSMQLRGDAPELYYTLDYQRQDRITATLKDHYDAYRADPSPGLAAYRESEEIRRLCQCYHFDEECRTEGKKLEEYKVGSDYIAFIRQMQDGLAQDFAHKGIMIECNPTSNYLIGTFRRYDRHPIFRFNNARLIPTDGVFTSTPQLSVSINTDDLGVFDTTLENEYAILAASLGRMTDQTGKRRYTDDSIYQYLDNVREMGLEQSFYTRLLRTSTDPAEAHRSQERSKGLWDDEPFYSQKS